MGNALRGRRVDRLDTIAWLRCKWIHHNGYDKDGLDRSCQSRLKTDKRGKLVEIKYRSVGCNGYDRWDSTKTRLAAPMTGQAKEPLWLDYDEPHRSASIPGSGPAYVACLPRT